MEDSHVSHLVNENDRSIGSAKITPLSPGISKKSIDKCVVLPCAQQSLNRDSESTGYFSHFGEKNGSNRSFQYDLLMEKMIQLYAYHRNFNEYIAKQLAVVMLCLTFWVIASSFFVSLWKSLEVMQQVLAIALLFMSLIPIMSLANATNCVSQEVRKLGI